MAADLIRLWHGSQRWDPPPEIRAPAKGNAEHGAGIYACAHLTTAKKYAKGGGSLVELGLRSNLHFLEDIKVKAQTLIDFASTLPRLKKRAAIIQDLENCAQRSRDGSTIGLNTLLNLVVNHDAAVGVPAVEITHFLHAMGADASLWERPGGDDWLVIFNPDIIEKSVVRPSATIALEDWQLPTVKTQLQALTAQRAHLAALAQKASALHATRPPTPG